MQEIKTSTKYPVILVHGVAAKDNILFWGRIPERLKEAGMQVFLGRTNSWDAVEHNALLLQKSVDFVLNRCQTEKVNLIAHSKGGIDSRFLISTMGYAPKIASLTTISSPHFGSEIVDFIFDIQYMHTKQARKITSFLAELYGDKSPDPLKILEDLSTKNMIRFNLSNPNADSVYYSSYQSYIKNRFDDLSYFLTYDFIYKISGPNDGIVSLKSSQWGEDCTLIKGVKTRGISHSEIIDMKRKKISGVDIPNEYLKITEKLIAKGC